MTATFKATYRETINGLPIELDFEIDNPNQIGDIIKIIGETRRIAKDIEHIQELRRVRRLRKYFEWQNHWKALECLRILFTKETTP